MKRAWKISLLVRLAAPLLLAVSGGVQASAAPAKADAPPLVPLPARIESAPGAFTVQPGTQVLYTEGGERAARYFSQLIERTHGIALDARQATRARDRAVVFQLQVREGASVEEGYSLIVSPRRITISSGDPRGLFYGAVSLWQLLPAAPRGAQRLEVPALRIEDAPRFSWRGLMLDSARHYQSPDFIKRIIDQMALHKLNVFHWHLTDDQGWRLEIRKYPRLTEIGAWRVPAGAAPAADIDPATGKPRLIGGYYSQEQVHEIVAYAAERHITIVPEIDVPGHASAAIAAYPKLGVTDAGPLPQRVPADWGVYHNLFNAEESTFTFLEDVFREVIKLFPGQYVHIGGDEVVGDQWRDSPRVQSRMRELGLADEHALQGYFTERIGRFLERHGKRLIGWDEILEGGLPPEATVMSWRGLDGALAAARAGHDTVLTPAPTLYLDHRALAGDFPGRGLVVSLEDVYRFDPMPAELSEAERRHILGVQANVWTEHMRTPRRVEQMTFPRAAALAEVAWTPASRIDWESFEARLPAQLERYRRFDIDYLASMPEQALAEGRRTSHQLEPCSKGLVLSLEDDAPVQGERAAYLVDIMNPCWMYRGADLSEVRAITAAVGQVPFNFQIGRDIERVRLRKPHAAGGELEVRLGSCEGEPIAVLPLSPATHDPGITQLEPAKLEPRAGVHDLCLTFTQSAVDPLWVIDEVALLTSTR